MSKERFDVKRAQTFVKQSDSYKLKAKNEKEAKRIKEAEEKAFSKRVIKDLIPIIEYEAKLGRSVMYLPKEYIRFIQDEFNIDEPKFCSLMDKVYLYFNKLGFVAGMVNTPSYKKDLLIRISWFDREDMQ